MSTNATERAESGAEGVAGQARGIAEQAAERAEAGINQAAAVAAQAAERLRGGGEKTQHATEAAAEGLERASEYMHDHDTSTIMRDAMRFARKHPLQVAAAVVGAYVLARIAL